MAVAVTACNPSQPSPAAPSPSAPTAGAEDVALGDADVTELLPPFHDELERLIVDEQDGSMLLLSAKRGDEPRDLSVQLIALDRGRYAVADGLVVSCGYLDEAHLDIDGPALFLDCTGGATAHFLHAFVPEALQVGEHPARAGDESSGWLHVGWEPMSADGVDGLQLRSRTCEPSCAEGGLETYSLVWDGTFFTATSCTSVDGREATLEFNASAFEVLTDYAGGCPEPPEPALVTEPLTLDVDGIGDMPFGTPASVVLEHVSSLLGPPVHDTGRQDASGPFGTCAGDQRMIAWGPTDQTGIHDNHWLRLLFIGSAEDLPLAWWGAYGGLPSEVTMEARIGRTEEQLRQEYGDDLQVYEDELTQETVWRIERPQGVLEGHLDDDDRIDYSSAPAYPCGE